MGNFFQQNEDQLWNKAELSTIDLFYKINGFTTTKYTYSYTTIYSQVYNQIKRFPTPVLHIKADTETDKRMKTQASQQDLRHLICNAS